MDSKVQLIRDVILSMTKPFCLSDLFDRLSKKGITDRDFILDILDEIMDAGLVIYSEVIDDCWAYSPVIA